MDKLRSGINSRRKAEKTPQSAAFGIICIFLAGCGVNALSDNVNLLAYFRPGITQPNGAVKYRFFRRRMAAVEAEVTFTLKLECFTRNRIFQRRFSKALFDHQRLRVNHRQEIIRSTRVRHAEQTIVQADFNRQRMCRAHPVNNTFDFTTICRIFA